LKPEWWGERKPVTRNDDDGDDNNKAEFGQL
jgi:hypothetical protein